MVIGESQFPAGFALRAQGRSHCLARFADEFNGFVVFLPQSWLGIPQPLPKSCCVDAIEGRQCCLLMTTLVV